MKRSKARALAWSVWGLTFLLLLGMLALSPGSDEAPVDWLMAVVALVSILGYATVGALIASRHPGNAIGWLFLYFGLSFLLAIASDEYSRMARTEGLPGREVAVLVNQAIWPMTFGALPVVLLLFPSGRLASRRWRPVAWGVVTAVIMTTLGTLLAPGRLAPDVPNPLGIEGLAAVTVFMRIAGGAGAFVGAFLSVVAIFLRYRRAGGEERQQIRWLAYVGGIALTLLLLLLLSGLIAPAVEDVLWISFFMSIAVGIPVASGIAILRHRLFDLDIVIRKTVVFGILAAFITAAYLLVVIGVPAVLFGTGGSDQSFVPFAVAAVLALLFQPVRTVANRLANRVVYGRRATPYELLSEFASRAGGEYSVDDVLLRMARAAAEGTGAASASVWLRVGNRLRESAAWPPSDQDGPEIGIRGSDLPDLPEQDRTFPVRHNDEVLGALAVRASAADPLTPAKEKLLEDLAGQAGLILRNVRLTEELRANLEELRASRQRLVAAQDEERRRLERNIHDGAQQQLVALSVKLRLAENLARKDPDKAAKLMAGVREETQQTLEDLRDLARGIYPPLLADQGLAAALEAQARKAAVPVVVHADGMRRYPQEAEAAVYFCVLEALQNIAKYAEASAAAVRLAEEDGQLVFTVTDDGRGFDPAVTPRGSGLQNMADRVDAIGGRIQIASRPGEGTTITGRIPVGGER